MRRDGFESGLDKSLKEAPFFYWFYTALIVLGAGLVLWPDFPLVHVIILSQVLNGVLLPVIMIFMLKLINKHELMGKHTNSTWFNWVAWITAAIVIGLSLVMVENQLHAAWNQHARAASASGWALEQLAFGEVADEVVVCGEEVVRG